MANGDAATQFEVMGPPSNSSDETSATSKFTLEMVSGVLPLFVSVTVRVAEAPTPRLPKFTLTGVGMAEDVPVNAYAARGCRLDQTSRTQGEPPRPRSSGLVPHLP